MTLRAGHGRRMQSCSAKSTISQGREMKSDEPGCSRCCSTAVKQSSKMRDVVDGVRACWRESMILLCDDGWMCAWAQAKNEWERTEEQQTTDVRGLKLAVAQVLVQLAAM
eukprot:227663-Rhodomonas_salina.1